MEYRPNAPSLTEAAARQMQQADLAQRQKRDRDAFAQRMARYAAEDAADEKARQQRLETERRACVDAAERELKAQLQARFLSTPGSTLAAFNAAWPEMLRRHQIEATMSGESLLEQTAREMAQRYGGRIS